ncbi:hypothetical protein Tco_1444269 [Tanacetum coccineum]
MRPPSFNNQGNQSRYQGNNFNQNHQNNQGQVFQPSPTNQPPVYQVPPYQALTPQIQGVSKTDFENYVKANDAVLKNVQNQGQNLQNQMANVTSLFGNNFRQQINGITTRSGKTLEEPSTPLVPTPDVSNPQNEPNLETSTEKVQNPNLENTAHVPPLGEEDSIFMEIPKPKAKKTVNVEIGLKDALVEMPKFNKWLSSLLRNKEKLEEIAIIPTCYLHEQVSWVARRYGKISFPGAFTSTRRTCAFAIPLENPFLRTAKALIDLYEETLTLRVGKEELVYYADKSEKNKHFVHTISVIDFSRDDPFSGSTTTYSDDPSPSSSSVKTKDVEIKNSNVSDEPVLLNTPLSKKVECFALEDYNDEIDAFLAMEVSSNFEEGYFDSEGDVTFLDNLLSDDTTHNLAPKVISDHEPEQNESSITFSPRSDPLHHEFAEEIITFPSRNDREFEEYLSLMTVLCEISTSRSQENVHANQSSIIESLPVEDSEPVQEEIDIFLVPDDLISPGVENDDSEDENHQDDPSIPRPLPEPPDVEKCLEPEVGILITKVFKGVSKPHDFMADILPTLPTLVSDLTFILFLSSFLSFGSEDTIFDPGIFT